MAADIRIGRYRITSDPHNWIVSEVKSYETGAREGEEYESNPQYCGSLEQALNLLLSRALRESDARSLQELKDEINLWRGEVLAALGIRV